MANEYTKRYLEKRKSQKEQTPSLYQLAKERTESQLKSYTPQPTQKQPAKTTTRVNKLDVQDERAYQSKKRSSFSERMKTAGSSSISDQLKSFSKERSLIRQYERDKRKKESDVFEAPFKITPSVSDSEKISYGMGGTPFSSPSEIRKQAQARLDYTKDMNRPSAGEYLGAIGTGGLSSFNQALFSTLDFFTPTELLFGEENDPVSKLNRYYSSEKDKYMTRTQDTFERSGEAGKFIGELGVSTVQTLPNTILALMSGGGSIAAQGSSALGQSATGLASAISTAFNNMIRTPTFWTSALQMVGPAYDEARAEGAGEIEAMTTALISGIINSGVEVGGGLETLPAQIRSGSTNAIRGWVSSMLDEGKEEVVQGIVDNLTRKSIYDQNREWFSTDDENAVFNPVRSAEEFAGGALVGGLLGGSQILASNAINRAGAAIQEQAQRKADAIPPSATREDILYQLAQDMANERLGGVNEDKVSVAPRSSNPYTVYTQGPQPAQKVNPARDPAMVDYIAETLGKNGSVSMRRLYDGEMDTDAYSAEFLESYSAGMRGDEKPAPQSLTPAQSEAAYVAGQADRKGKTAAPIGRQTGGDTYGRTEEALVGRHEARGYDDTGTYRPVLRKRDTTGTGLRGDETKGSGSTAVYAGGNEKRAEVNQAVSGPVIRGGDTYGRTEEALVGRHEVGGYDPGGAGGPVLRERGAAQTGDSRADRGNEAIPAGRPGPAGAGEAGREIIQTARSWQEDPAAFTARSTERGGVVRQIGKVSVAYRETEPARWSAHTRETVEAFREFGIEPRVVDFLERNSNGYTSRSEEAVTSPEGEIYLIEGSSINGREVAAHEALHKGLREKTPEAQAYLSLVKTGDLSSEVAAEYLGTIITEYFEKRGRNFDPQKDWERLLEEYAAYMSGFLGDGSAREQLGAAYADFDALERQWQAMKEAMGGKPDKNLGENISFTQPTPFDKSYKPEKEIVAETPQQRVSDSVKPFIEKNTPLTSKKLFELADKAYGGTMAEGAYTVKDAYDGMELAVNQYLIGSDLVKNANGDAETAKSTISKMKDILNLLPTQTKRTEEMESYQQFSTPPNIAYIAAWAANVNNSDVVLEPSAGIGGLALWPKAWGATVYGNELSERRLSFLNQLGLDGTFNLNAEQIDNLLPDNVKPSVVIMNPPFSSTAGRMTKKSTANAKRHIEQALERLEPGGRLVAILGNGMANDAPAFKSWWDELRSEYGVRANIRIDGSNYKKYGTTFDIQLAIIDKTGPSTSETLTGEYTDISQIPELLEGIRNDRGAVEAEPVQRGERGTRLQPGSAEGRRDAGGSKRAVRNAPVDTAEEAVPGDNVRGERPVQPERTGRAVRKRAERKRRSTMGESDGNVSPDVPGQSERIGDQPGRVESEPKRSGTVKEKTAKLDKKSKKVSTEAIDHPDSVYSAYIPKKARIVGSVQHPAKLVESAAMAAVEPPDVTYTPNIPQDIITSGKLSDAQLENIIYAGQSHEQMLPNGTRRGYFIGDGTGVGKGRQISGIILDNFRQGRQKAVWISRSSNLFQDAIRDWTDLGGEKNDILSFNKVKLGQEIPADSKILFSSYDTLKQEKKEGSRLDMIQNWLGKDFDGVIVFDEAHTMNKAISQKGARGRTKPAGRALAGIKLQEMFPNARVVYASATGATSVDGYAYLERLGLWGKGTAFNDVNDFISKISDGGLAAMELVARDMKSMGVYMARSISYDDVRYDTVQHDLTPMQTQIYNTLSKAWQTVFQNIDKALVETGASKNGMARSAAWSAFYGAQQRFYNQVITSMSMPTVIQNIRKDLDDGKSVVIQLVNTNQASADRAISEAENTGVSLEELDLTPSDTLVQLLEKSFPVQAFEEYTDDKGNIQSRPVHDKDGNPVLDKKAIRQRDALIEQVKQMKVPDGPLEMLFDSFGVEQVAEVTGRTRRVVEKKDEKGHLRRVVESRSQNSGIADAQMFQDGEKRILVFSDAGGTGKSYHADLRAKNQQQRVHYLLQPGWNASNATQGFGRTHRSNEASAPIFRLVTTNIMGQKRFTSTIARRLDQLGALTKGQRQTGSGIFSAKDNLESPLAQDALEQYYKSMPVDIVKKLGLYQKLYDQFGVYKPDQNTARDIGKFLNRILSLEVDEQNEVFQGFYDVFDRMMDSAIANGTLDVGLENYVAEKIDVIDENVIRTDKSGADTKYVQMKAYKKPELVTYGQLEEYRSNFKKLVRMEDGSVRAVYEISSKTNAKGEIEKRFRLQSPVMSKYSTFVENTLNSKTTNVPKKEWKKAWDEAVSNAPKYEESTLHMLTGALLPIWDKLPTENTRVVRVIVQDGRQYLGRLIRADQIDGVLKNLGSTRKLETYTPDQISEKVLNHGMEVILRDNRTRIVRSRVSNEWRMEIIGQNVWYLPQQINGIISERINYQYRYFIPTGERGVSVLNELMSINPVVDIRESVSDATIDRMAGSSAMSSYPDQWTTDRVGSTDEKTLPVSDIVRKIRHRFGINITTGHMRGSKARGQYNRSDYGVRTKIANDLPTVSHELGHHLDNLYGLTKNLPSDLRAELIDNLDQGMKDAYSKKKWVTEGFAEFVRRFLQNRETAAIDYPQFTEHFLSSVKNTDGPIIEQLADEINAYYALDTSTATSSVRLAEERGMDFRTIKEKAKEMGDDIYQAWVDSNHAIKRFDERAGSNVYLFATNSAYSDSMAGQILTGDLTDRNGQYVAPGLKTALSGVNLKNKSEYRAFGEYLIVRHGPERLKEGLRVFADDRKNSTTWMEGRQAALEEQYPAFKEAADRLYQFESDFLRTWGVETGLVSGKSADEWEERWKYYVPFNRAMDKQRAGAKKGYANQSSGIKKAIGSGLDIVHPVDNIVFNVTRMVNAGVRNNVMKELTSAAQRSGGMADFLEKVPMPLQRKSYDATKLKGGLKQSIEESSMSQEDKDAAFDIVENIDDILYQYGRGKAGGDVVTVMKGGKLEYWKINDKSLLSSITAMSPAKLPAVLEAYGAVSRFMTGNITGNNLLWSIFSNSPRDMMTLFTYSKDKNPLKLFGGVMSTYANQMKGQNADPLFKEYLAMGGGKSSAYTADRSLAKRTRKKLTNKSALEWLNPMEVLSAVSDSIEMGPRFAYYKILRQKGVSPQQAFYESADITTNFRRRGTNSQALNKFIPFFNASVQGLDKFSRWIRATEVPSDKRAKAVRVRTTAYILSSALLAALIYGINNRDDESEKEYEQLSNYTKNAYWAIPIGDGKFFTIPKPREIAVLSSFFETLAEYFYGDNRHAFDGFYDYASENFLPTGASDVAKMDLYGFIGSLGLIGVGANMMANRDFMGRPIVSAGLQSLEPKDQYTNRTSAIAKAVGGAFNQSPQMIDYFFGQTLGGWWKMQKALFPVDGSQRDLTLGIQGTYVKDNQYSIDLLNWLYDKADASAAVSKSDPGNTEKAIESKWDSNMTTFYSRYNKLSKDKSETTATRATRQTVLDMILEYQKSYDNGTKTAGQKAVESVCKSAGTTEYLPSVVQSTIKDEKEQSHTLSAAQYVEYQGEYLRLYWEAVEEALPSAKTQSEKEKVLKYAKSVAADTAKARALKRIGAAYDKSDADNGGLSVGDVARFEAAYSQAKGEIDEDTGETIPGTKQDAVIEALENMSWLTDEERDYLFSTKYTSDKNNPWAGMAPDEEEEISIEAKDEAVNRLLSGIYW